MPHLPLALAALTLLIWVYLLAGRGRFWRMRDETSEIMLRGEAPDVAAVVPARNEADVVAHAVGSLARQDYPGRLRIVLVDDASDDGTAVAAQAAAPLLRVVSARPLPAGWTGKMWAVREGVRAAAGGRPEFYLLTDADIVHPPGNVAGLVALACMDDYDLVSYMVTLECRTVAEQSLIPAFVFFFFLLYPPAWIRDVRYATAGAAGGCILVRREALERIGGVERIRGELIDDCALAREIKHSGGKVWLGLSASARSVRSYRTFGEIGRMISRTAFTQLGHSWWLLAMTIAGLAVTYLAPPVLTLSQPPGAARGIGALAWLLMSVAYFPAVRFYRRPWYFTLLLPLAAVFYMGATVHSAVQHWRGRGGSWKGRTHTIQ